MNMNGSLFATAVLAISTGAVLAAEPAGDADLWALAQRHADVLTFSTLFTAQDVRDRLSKPEQIAQVIRWCKATAVTHVYVESFRGGYTPDKETLLAAKRAFTEAGVGVSGCITTTDIGRKSVRGWIFPCFSEQAGLDNMQRAFEYAAGLFDEIMIDDFFATSCECDDCLKARGDRSWSEFRCRLMAEVSRKYVLEPARRVNPKVKIIIKYPQWYDNFHERGYDVAGQTETFDKIWVGTELRDPDDKEWGRKTQYEGYFIMRWLGGIGGAKCGGGWFDPYGTSPATYLEQARQTVLGGGREAVLFCYGSLHEQKGPADVEALRKELPGLFELAGLIRGQEPRGIAAPKPPNSDGKGNEYVYDFVGMLGLPLAPCTQVRADAPAAFLPVQVLKDPEALAGIQKMIAAKTPLLMTRQLADKLPASLRPEGESVQVLEVPKDAWALMDLPAERLRDIRKRILAPLGVEFDAPTRVVLCLFGKDLAVVENFNDKPIEARLVLRAGSRPALALALPAGSAKVSAAGGAATVQLPPRSLAVVRFER